MSDILIVGGGFRAIRLLTAVPEMLEFDVTILERSPSLGAGAYGDYDVMSSSVASRFFSEVCRDGVIGEVLDEPDIRMIAQNDTPIALTEIGRAYRRLGDVVANVLGDDVHTGVTVSAIDIDPSSRQAFVASAGERTFGALVCLLATGRREDLLKELHPWRDRVLLTTQVISMSHRRTLLAALEMARKVVIVGGSHSAMSSLEAILAVTEGNADRRLEVVVAHRSPVRLCYESVDEAQRGQVPERELIFDPQRHACPSTGIVFRDTGLRHGSKDLYLQLWAGELPGCRAERIRSIGDYAPSLDDADVIIQSTGFRGNAPMITVRGVDTGLGDITPFSSDREGRLTHPTSIAEVPLHVLRLEQTPVEERDHGDYGSDSHRRVGAALVATLDGLGCSRVRTRPHVAAGRRSPA